MELFLQNLLKISDKKSQSILRKRWEIRLIVFFTNFSSVKNMVQVLIIEAQTGTGNVTVKKLIFWTSLGLYMTGADKK